MMEILRDTVIQIEGGVVPVPAKAGEIFIYLDAVTPGVQATKGVRGWIGSQGGTPVIAIADARDVGPAPK
jgi:hypothetical protein